MDFLGKKKSDLSGQAVILLCGLVDGLLSWLNTNFLTVCWKDLFSFFFLSSKLILSSKLWKEVKYEGNAKRDLLIQILKTCQLCNTIVFQVKKCSRHFLLPQNYCILIISTKHPSSSRTYHHLNILQVACCHPQFLLLSDPNPYFLNHVYTGGRNFKKTRCILLNIFHILQTLTKRYLLECCPKRSV